MPPRVFPAFPLPGAAASVCRVRGTAAILLISSAMRRLRPSGKPSAGFVRSTAWPDREAEDEKCGGYLERRRSECRPTEICGMPFPGSASGERRWIRKAPAACGAVQSSRWFRTSRGEASARVRIGWRAAHNSAVPSAGWRNALGLAGRAAVPEAKPARRSPGRGGRLTSVSSCPEDCPAAAAGRFGSRPDPAIALFPRT